MSINRPSSPTQNHLFLLKEQISDLRLRKAQNNFYIPFCLSLDGTADGRGDLGLLASTAVEDGGEDRFEEEVATGSFDVEDLRLGIAATTPLSLEGTPVAA